MKKYILFSNPSESVLEKLAAELFLKPNMKIAYMPSDGSHPGNPKYEAIWRTFIESNGAEIIPIDNSLRGIEIDAEIEKIKNSDAIILTGGNTFQFLAHLKETGLDKAIIDHANSEKIVVGFSAGAIILSQTIEIATLPSLDENIIGISDLSGLNLIDFDIYPHYEEAKHKAEVDQYEQNTAREVRRLTDEDLIVV